MTELLDRCLDNKCVQLAARVLKWVPVLFVMLLSGWAYYVFVYELCFMLVSSIGQRIAFLVIFHVLLAIFLWAYLQVVFTFPALPSSRFYLASSVVEKLCAADNDFDYRCILDGFAGRQELGLHNRAFNKGIRFCIKCACIKPDRSHHCSTCGHCVLRFDHHCPWVNNCIGYANYKQFVLFLAYGLYLCVFDFFAMLPFVIAFFRHATPSHSSAHWTPASIRRLEMVDAFGKYQVLLLFFVAAVFGVSLFCLLLYHLYLIAKNRTTVESFRAPVFMYGPDAGAYDLGLLRNFQQVFGPNPLLWLIPIFSSPGNGCEFPTRSATAPRNFDFTEVDATTTVPVVPTKKALLP